ncbi:hypothetical protein BGX27_011507 [Mortierella sp. AM989]|nr:hypothetical protein BGX27_011507 [Mortierella sp. AM989]
MTNHLPPAQQIAFIPESGFNDQFFHITERLLVMTLMSNEPRGGPIHQIFGETQHEADEHIASHPGDLFYNLFSHSGLDYYRNTLLILTSQPTFRHRAKKRFLELNQEEKDEFDVLAQDLRTSKIKVTKEAFFEFVGNQLKSPEENKADIDESFGGYQKGNRRSNRRNVLTGTMTTNGHELKILAYSLTKPKPPSHPVPNTTQFKLKSILTELGNSTQVNDTFPQDRHRSWYPQYDYCDCSGFKYVTSNGYQFVYITRITDI